MVNLPLGEGFALRAQAAYLDKDGYVRRGDQWLGAEKDWVGRLQLRGELAPGLTATAGLMFNRSESNGTPFVVQEFDLRPGIEPAPGFVGIQGNYGDWLNDSFKSVGQAPIAPYNDPRIVRGKLGRAQRLRAGRFRPRLQRRLQTNLSTTIIGRPI